METLMTANERPCSVWSYVCTCANSWVLQWIPSFYISSLLPLPMDHHVTSRLRAASVYPQLVTRTKRFTSFINYSLLYCKQYTFVVIRLCLVPVAPVVVCCSIYRDAYVVQFLTVSLILSLEV